MTRLTQALSIRSGESRMASLMIGIMLVTAMGAALGGTGIEALFFARFGVQYLPYMFVGLGITSMILSFGFSAALGSIPRRVLYISIPLLIAIILILARLALFTRLSWLYPALWLGKEILNFFTGILIWGIAGVVCDTRQAKRLFPLFNASRILGQVIGGFITGALVNSIGVENLLLVWSSTMLLAFILSRTLLQNRQLPSPPAVKSRQKQPTLIQEMQSGYQYVRKSRLMRWVSLAAILFSVLYFSISLPFSRAATEQYVNEKNLAAFLGLFNGLSTAAAFLASLFFANRLFARFGIMLCILVFPIIYLVGFASLALLPIFTIVVLFRFVQMLWLSGIADPAYQAMFNVVPNERRDQVRTFIDGVPEQAGVFIAGTILIIGEQTLAPQQLYIVGLIAAALCTFAIYRAHSGYNEALIEALQAGNPHLFYSEEQPFGGFRQDVEAIRGVLKGLIDPDPILRRVSAEILGHLSLPEAELPLLNGLGDSDPSVRASCLRALAQTRTTSTGIDKIAASLQDPEPDVRFEAVAALSALTVSPSQLEAFLNPILADRDSRVSTRAASALLKAGCNVEKASSFLRYTSAIGDLSDRENAIIAMGEWGDTEAFEFLANELKDPALPVLIRRAVLASLKRIDPAKALSYLIAALGYEDISIREAVANLIGQIGQPAMESLLLALKNPKQEEGALLALNGKHLPIPPARSIEEYTRTTVSRAIDYEALMRGVRSETQNEATSLLVDSLQKKSADYGIRALRAIGLLGDRDSMDLAIEILKMRNVAQQANVIEALESLNSRSRTIIQPLMRIWEEESGPEGKADWGRLIADEDLWIRDCALFAAHKLGEFEMENIATLSLMERILLFKRVPLFAALAPVDIKQVAAIAQEESFCDGDLIAQQGDVGDVMFIIVSGEVSVVVSKDQKNIELAKRKPGEYVGEMALISKEPRNATLAAIGNVRALSIDQKSFEALLRDRLDVSLAVIQVLCERLKQASNFVYN
jgi:CRP/FNR family cyclic AMP-dependent transcriptional regulator